MRERQKKLVIFVRFLPEIAAGLNNQKEIKTRREIKTEKSNQKQPSWNQGLKIKKRILVKSTHFLAPAN